MLVSFAKRGPLKIYCDGAIGSKGRAAGSGAVVRDQDNRIISVAKRGLPVMTNNEAEYAALILGLEAAWHFRPESIHVYMDSEIVVGQMQGQFAVRSAALKQWHTQACRLAQRFRQVIYEYVPREGNRLADALAAEALEEAEHAHRR